MEVEGGILAFLDHICTFYHNFTWASYDFDYSRSHLYGD